MKIEEPKYKRIIFWALQLTGWFTFGTIDIYIRYVDGATDFKNILGQIITHGTGILVTYLLYLIYRRINSTGKSILHTFFYIIICSVPTAIVWVLVDNICSIPLWGFDTIFNGYIAISGIEKFSGIFYNSLIIISWSGLYFGIKYTLEWNIQNEKIEKTQLLLESAQLGVLRYQLNPHFLFNSLSSLRMLIRKDSKKAEQMLNKIAEFLRYTLIIKNNHEVPFSEELKAIQQYFEIEKIRFDDKIEIKYDIDPLAEDFPVPIFLVHPIVENAIKYGMDTSQEKLNIDLTARVVENDLTVEVINTGHWVEPDKNHNGMGMGLKNVQKRLEFSYPKNNKLVIERLNGKVKVSIFVSRIPEQK